MSVTLKQLADTIGNLDVSLVERSLLLQLATQLCELSKRMDESIPADPAALDALRAKVGLMEQQQVNDNCRERSLNRASCDRLDVLERRLHNLEDCYTTPPNYGIARALPTQELHTGDTRSPLPRWQACAIQRTMNGVIVHDPLVQGVAAGYVFGDLRTAADFVVAVLSQEKPT